MTLPADVARCAGNVYVPDSMEFACIGRGCEDCQRRLIPQSADRIVWMSAPMEHPCPMRIAPEGK